MLSKNVSASSTEREITVEFLTLREMMWCSYDKDHIILSYNRYKLNSQLTCSRGGIIAQSVEHRTEIMGLNPVEASDLFLAFTSILREMICGKCLWSQCRPCSRLLVLNWALCQDKMSWLLWGSYRLPNRSSAGISLHTIISYTMMLQFYLLTELYHTLGPEVFFLRERRKSSEVAISEREERENLW